MASILFSMATFHAIGKGYFTILVSNYGVVQVTKNVLCAMFAFNEDLCMFLMMFLMRTISF